MRIIVRAGRNRASRLEAIVAVDESAARAKGAVGAQYAGTMRVGNVRAVLSIATTTLREAVPASCNRLWANTSAM
jgi:hypothetical protein